jgi:NADH:ubiquinone oxidoreductase subunit F (NADH-binding)/(2Fe-2S) ferredoxin/ferredoxin
VIKAKTYKDGQKTVLVCQGTGCVSGKSIEITRALAKEVQELGLQDVHIDFTGCHGFCEQGPVAIVEPEGIFYTNVTVADVPEIAASHLRDGQPVRRLFYKDPLTKHAVEYYKNIKFYSKQQRIVLRNCGHINPERIEDYLAVGGYEALKIALHDMRPLQVIDTIKRSGLRGRGGAGFSTGQKWTFCQQEPGDVKYMICNADEGDPGAFMDRSTMEGDPHSILEGMAIAAYAIGAHEGYIYVRAEYPLAVKRVRLAIEQAEEQRYLGQNILGSKFSFKIHVKEGAGAFVCGEETALMASIEGKRGMPRTRPPYPAVSGLWGKPTIINNVKTLASVPAIISQGAEWYAAIGTEKSKGTCVFALTGKIANSGLIEVPMGIKLREIIYDIGGGIPGGKKFKAVQTGGPSGGCLPESHLDNSVDYESLTEAGSMMGSGGMVVMDEDTCMVDVARYFLSFTQAESCGKCVPCRVGTKQMLDVLERICRGEGAKEDIPLLEKLASQIKIGSLCQLGQTAPNPVLTTLRYFKDEYEAHINARRCPALSCAKLVQYYIDPEKCQACGICAKQCPSGAITGGTRLVHIIDQEKCIKCGSCLDACPPKFNAIVKKSGEKMDVPKEPVPVKAKPHKTSATTPGIIIG